MSTDEELKALKKRHADQLWTHPAVSGIDVGDDINGQPIFTVLLKSKKLADRKDLPTHIEGHRVRYRYGPVEKQ